MKSGAIKFEARLSASVALLVLVFLVCFGALATVSTDRRSLMFGLLWLRMLRGFNEPKRIIALLFTERTIKDLHEGEMLDVRGYRSAFLAASLLMGNQRSLPPPRFFAKCV